MTAMRDDDDIPGLVAGLAVLRMVPVIELSNARRARELTRVAVLCAQRGHRLERWLRFQSFKRRAIAARNTEWGSRQSLDAAAGEVAVLACRPGFEFTGSRLDDVRHLALGFWEECDDTIDAAGLEAEARGLTSGLSLEAVESEALDHDLRVLQAARRPVLDYTGMCLVTLNAYPRLAEFGSVVARAGGWSAR
ncbi:hypothetical protein ACIGB8_09045 [Promicromonospora sukumoe]|uniref:hypothetical protein n=1 Tax=Promicromonospora sukumoe TaxID=88382 RepID=UPI0037C90EC9